MPIPNAFAERESCNNPPTIATAVTTPRPPFSPAYTIRLGSKSICAPMTKRRPLMVDCRKTTTKATNSNTDVWSKFMAVSLHFHKDFLERVDAHREFHARFLIEPVANGSEIDQVSDQNAGGENAAFAAGDDALARTKLTLARQIRKIHQRRIEWTR